jgi:hypothetical protein
MHVHEWVELWKQIENKLKVNSNRKTITHNIAQIQRDVTSLFETEILSFTNH